MFKDRRNPETIQVDERIGCVTCPECHIGWEKKYVPEFCINCGIQVTDAPGRGEEELIQAMERAKVPMKIVVCNYCGQRYIDTPNLAFCFRCYTPIGGRPVEGLVAGLIKRLLSMRARKTQNIKSP